MNKRIIIIIFIVWFICPSSVFALENHRYKCSTKISETKDLTYLYVNKDIWSVKYYQREKDQIYIGNVGSKLITYIFWKGEYYGYIVAVNGKKNIDDVQKYLFKNNKYLIESEGNRSIWVKGDEVIKVTRFSVHQAQVAPRHFEWVNEI